MSITKAGWQGIVADVPDDWSITAVSGEAKQGYFRLDSTKSQVLEVKWSKFSGKPNLHGKLTAYLEDLKKKAKKRKLNFEYKINAKDEFTLNFSWKSDRKANGKIWKCDDCGNILIAQLSGDLNEEISDAASRIFPTIVDHSEDKWKVWGVYGLVTEIPPGYILETHQLMAGYLKLAFRNKNDKIIIERWGLANTVLKNMSLKEWYMQRSVYDLKNYSFNTEEILFEENEKGLKLNGRRSSLKEHLQTVIEFISLKKPSYKLDAYVWYCEESNKIFSVQTVHSKIENVIDNVIERTICH